MRGEALRLPTAISWQLARVGLVGESEEAAHRTLSAREPENPVEKGNCSFFENVALEPIAEQNEMILPLPSFGGRSCAVLTIF